jgi:hypothetical protein
VGEWEGRSLSLTAAGWCRVGTWWEALMPSPPSGERGRGVVGRQGAQAAAVQGRCRVGTG